MKDAEVYREMLELQIAVSDGRAREVARLQDENARLRRTIADLSADATTLQDRLTMLEVRVSATADALVDAP